MSEKKYLDYEGLQVYTELIKSNFAQQGALVFKGTVAAVSGLPALTGASAAHIGDVYMTGASAAHIGDVYMFSADATTSADFVEGAGQPINEYDEVVCVNVGTEQSPTLKWEILGPVFDVSDRLQFGNALPANPSNGQTFLYMGNTTYTYSSVTPEGSENPQEEGWYVSDGAGGYTATSDTSVQSGTTYYERAEQYVHGVIYVYNSSGSEWVAQSSGDAMVAITTSEIMALFD